MLQVGEDTDLGLMAEFYFITPLKLLVRLRTLPALHTLQRRSAGFRLIKPTPTKARKAKAPDSDYPAPVGVVTIWNKTGVLRLGESQTADPALTKGAYIRFNSRLLKILQIFSKNRNHRLALYPILESVQSLLPSLYLKTHTFSN